ncbi:MAG: tetratricopeptide repeat protein [Promethearchaeota archaeon]|nr:MAG: tetratricopeptide repeat protein [Candidatus Lokiarchaeota archaeon]
MIIYLGKNEEITKEELSNLIKETKAQLLELEKFGKNSEYIKELSNLALLQIENSDFEQSEKNLLICLKHFKKQHDTLGQAAVYGLMGTLKYKTKSYLQSIEHYEKANEIYEDLNQKEEVIACLKGIGKSLINLNRLDEASDIYFKCSAICSDNNDLYNLLDCLGNLIIIYEKLDEWEILYELYQKSLKTFSEMKDQKGIIVTNFNLGIIKKKHGEYEDALYYFKSGTNIAIDSNFAEYIVKGLSYVAECLFYQGKMNDSKQQYLRALKLARKVNMNNAIVQLRVLLNSLGLNDDEIEKELNTLGD